jgi:hypothetical protein
MRKDGTNLHQVTDTPGQTRNSASGCTCAVSLRSAIDPDPKVRSSVLTGANAAAEAGTVISYSALPTPLPPLACD